MKLTVRRAAAADLPTLLQIFDNARAFMRTHGNPHQWPDSYPGAVRLTAEIERGVCYVVMGEGAIQAVFCLIPGDERPIASWRTVPGQRTCPTQRSTGWRRQGRCAVSDSSVLTGACGRACLCVPTPTPITSTCSARWKRAGL